MRYYYQIEAALRNNIGDVLQGMVAKAFLPQDSRVVDREELALMDNAEDAYLIANGWYLHSFEKFPPPASVSPLYVSVHVANAGLLRTKAVRTHFKHHGPVGCRDHKTLNLFLGWGIPAYFSGCLTVTTEARAPINGTGEGECLLVDNVDHPIPDDVQLKLESLLGEKLTRVSHNPPNTKGTLEEYDQKASAHMEMLLARYCRARLVITTKIHCALPCIGMGANVLVIHPNPSDPRLDTVREFVQVSSYEAVRRMSELVVPDVDREALAKRRNFLAEMVGEGVASKSNPVATLGKYRPLRAKARVKALLYRQAVRAMLLTRVGGERIQRVYGGADVRAAAGKNRAASS